MTETTYLKDELGPVLAKGLAAVAVARPQDPIEYLGLWLLHSLQKKEARAAELERAKVLEQEREVWAAQRAVREKNATSVIQREWRAHVSAVAEGQRREAELKQVFAGIEEIAEERFPEEGVEDTEGKSEQERNAEADRLVAQAQFGKSTLYIEQLDKSIAAQFKLISPTNHSAVLVIKCVFYLMGLRPKQLDSWPKIRTLIKPYPFVVFLKNFQPCSAPLERKRKITRVRRLLTTAHEDGVKEAGTAVFAIYSWLQALTQFREARDEHVKVLRAAGKEEEDLDDEEDAEDEEKDPDEEVVIAAEQEAKRQAELEAAEEAAEAGEEDGEDAQ